MDLIRRPSLDHTGTDFLEAWYGFLLVAGDAYVEAVSVDGEIRELHNLRPDRMKVLPGLDGWPEGYEYTAGGKSVRFIDEAVPGVRPILHTRLFHPANDHYGMSSIEAASVAIEIHNTASAWNKALLDNSARSFFAPCDTRSESRPQGADLIARSVRALEKRIGNQFPGRGAWLFCLSPPRRAVRCCWKAVSTGSLILVLSPPRRGDDAEGYGFHRDGRPARRRRVDRSNARVRLACRRCCWV